MLQLSCMPHCGMAALQLPGRFHTGMGPAAAYQLQTLIVGLLGAITHCPPCTLRALDYMFWEKNMISKPEVQFLLNATC